MPPLFAAEKIFFMLKVHSLETFGTHEGPGIRLVVFLQGCNFKCAYCHNPDTISSKGGRIVSENEIIKMLEDQAPYFKGGGGLTVSGGEPGLQARELLTLFKEAKKKGFHIALDTNASLDTNEYRELLDASDLALIDLKHFDNKLHLELTGKENKNVLKNISYREQSKKLFWIRYVLVPGWTDQEEHLEALGKYFKEFQYLQRFEILPYHTLGMHKYKELKEGYRLEGVLPPTSAEISKAEQIFKKYLNHKVFIRS